MQVILVGYGEIGKGVRGAYKQHQITPYDPQTAPVLNDKEYEVLLVAIPYSDDFIKIVSDYQKKFKVKATIIFSTVPIGTTRKLKDAVHSPVEGKHPYLAESIKFAPRWIGGYNEIVDEFFTGVNVNFVDEPEFTEFLKLQSTTKYGLNVEFARYVKEVCDKLDMDYEYVKDFDEDVNAICKHVGLNQFQRYILDPPNGPKGGHCVTPNAKLLNKQYPNEMVKIVGEE